METERKEYIVASKSFVPGVEITFGHREGVPEMEGAVHVGIGEGLEIFGLFVGFSCKVLMPFPDAPCTMLEGNQFVPSSGVLH